MFRTTPPPEGISVLVNAFVLGSNCTSVLGVFAVPDHAIGSNRNAVRLGGRSTRRSPLFNLLLGRVEVAEIPAGVIGVIDRTVSSQGQPSWTDPKRNFRRKMSLLKILKPIKEYRRGDQRPAQLYRFVAARFEKLKDKGIVFPF